jgi:hypothetical protein
LWSVTEFEQNANANLRLTAFGRHVFLTGATVLDELCHWGNFLNGVAETDGDAGDNFETAADVSSMATRSCGPVFAEGGFKRKAAGIV